MVQDMNRTFAVPEGREPVGHRLTRYQGSLAGRLV